MIRIAVVIAEQAGKQVLTGIMPASQIVTDLRSGALTVNPVAQRSLARGAAKETTKDLIEDDRVHRTPRMIAITRFFQRVMENVERSDNGEGFLGSVQLVIPETAAGAAGATVRFASVPARLRDELPASLVEAFDALGAARLGTLVARPGLGEAVFHVADGQGRCVGFYSFERAVVEEVAGHKRAMKKRERGGQPLPEDVDALRTLEALRDRVRKFLTVTQVPFVCYVDSIAEDGTVRGLPLDAEKRLYIEGNALNSQATKEEVLKYESFSPVVIELQQLRLENDWMGPDTIEEDSKTIGATSSKLFTLSALVQAFTLSVLGTPQPLSRVGTHDFTRMAERAEFVHAFWHRVTEIFQPVWLPVPNAAPSERSQYLKARRDEQHVAFQAVFLLALGRLGYGLGERADWDPARAEFAAIDALAPGRASYLARDGGEGPHGYDRRWVNAMMKQAKDAATGEFTRFVFNNSRENVQSTYELLRGIAGLPPDTTPVAESGDRGRRTDDDVPEDAAGPAPQLDLY